nr:hypothetical protein [Anaerolineae bacterium]
MLNQSRLLLLLDKSDEVAFVKQILKSPLGLAYELIQMLFQNRFDDLADKLDTIKQFVAGITRVNGLSEYKLAHYYPVFFAYHQFFHSSYRARQGNVLENLLIEWIKTSPNSLIVPHSKKDMRDLMKRVLPQYASKLDLDVVVADKNRLLCIQLRSRDDTGGTVAKMSLGEAARYMLRERDIAPDSHIFYVIGVWDARQHTQETVTKSKLYEVLKDDLGLSQETFFTHISQGIQIRPHLKMQLAYGYSELARVISDWTYGLDSTLLDNQIALISQTDDLWLAYLVAHLELESRELYGQNNITLLIDALKGYDYSTDSFTTSHDYVQLANDLAQKIASDWRADFPFLHTISEKIV